MNAERGTMDEEEDEERPRCTNIWDEHLAWPGTYTSLTRILISFTLLAFTLFFTPSSLVAAWTCSLHPRIHQPIHVRGGHFHLAPARLRIALLFGQLLLLTDYSMCMMTPPRSLCPCM